MNIDSFRIKVDEDGFHDVSCKADCGFCPLQYENFKKLYPKYMQPASSDYTNCALRLQHYQKQLKLKLEALL